MKPDYSKFTVQDVTKMEDITGGPAKALLVQSELLPTPPKGAIVLDNACGAGILTSLLFEAVGQTSDVRVVCGDIEEYMVNSAAERIKANGWSAEAVVVDAQAIQFPEGHFTHALINFGIQVIPDNALAVQELFRVLKPGGTLGMTAGTTPHWLASLQAVVPDFATPPIFTTGPMASKESITGLLAGAGFARINVQLVTFHYKDTMPAHIRYMKQMFPQVLVGEAAEKYEAHMRAKHGEGDFTLPWGAYVITAGKPTL
ncbi:S-adenosyl-L-methionine-dependent methyltransferase [Mycena belliarum]|uniref:S-adenosyl-L-methionine-dependent methyltransferase n=1 Tax=Mycena belliarum TaxID=1033014 RepID=A0AAD6TQ88_9AGAR|nr:S-adenosyl-L-methionine-dependent methyltransferase [Mycena belliae]